MLPGSTSLSPAHNPTNLGDTGGPLTLPRLRRQRALYVPFGMPHIGNASARIVRRSVVSDCDRRSDGFRLEVGLDQ